jgi:hypothetical protein
MIVIFPARVFYRRWVGVAIIRLIRIGIRLDTLGTFDGLGFLYHLLV